MTQVTDNQGNCRHQGLSCDLADALVTEAAQAVNRIETAADLDERIGTLRDRAEVSNDRLAAFIVTMPEGLDEDDQRVFKREVSQSLEAILGDAMSQVEYDRMWNRG